MEIHNFVHFIYQPYEKNVMTLWEINSRSFKTIMVLWEFKTNRTNHTSNKKKPDERVTHGTGYKAKQYNRPYFMVVEVRVKTRC